MIPESQVIEFGRILSGVNNLHLRSEALAKDSKTDTKYFITTTITNRLGAIKRDMSALFASKPQAWHIIQTQLLDAEMSLQLEDLNNMLLKVDKSLRDKIEAMLVEEIERDENEFIDNQK